MFLPRHILITGASSGLGAALAHAYAAPGTHLSLHGRSPDRLEQTSRGAKEKGATTSIHSGDVTDAVAVENWIEACDRERPLDLVIANAGVSESTAGVETAAQIDRLFATNVGGVVHTVQPALRCMQQRQHGQIAIISSLASFKGFAGAAAYCSTKAAVRVYGEGLRATLKSGTIEISVVCPGFIQTPMTEKNGFYMPFLLTADDAADLIRRGLQENRARIAFPLPLYLLVRAAAALPQSWMDILGSRLPRKGAS